MPYIPGSSFKGASRHIVREDQSPQAEVVAKLYADYLMQERIRNEEYLKRKFADEPNMLERIFKRYERPTAEALFGIEYLVNTPRLLFSDWHLKNEYRDKTKCFSIDAKTSILSPTTINSKPGLQEDLHLRSNPRTYKAVRCGVVFTGEIQLYKIELLGQGAQKQCRDYIIYNLEKFNGGIYRLGNSKSRGYGKVSVKIVGSNEV